MPKSEAHIVVNPAVNNVIDRASNPLVDPASDPAPTAASLPPMQQPSSLAAKSRRDDLGPVILPLVALVAPHFAATKILTPPSHCQPSAVVLSSPHAGRVYPAEFIAASIANVTALRGLEDFGVDQLIGSVCDHGITCINNQISRAYIDVNRPVDALDNAMFTSPPAAANTAAASSRHVRAGYGLLPRLTAAREVINRQLLPSDEVERRIALVHRPYHQALQAALATARSHFGRSLLIDCHSMPPHDQHDKPLADFVLGDLHHSTLDPAIGDLLAKIIIEAGYSLAWNHPYAGGYITKNYGRATTHQQSIQIEINRHLYMTRKYTLDQQGSENIAALLARIGAVLSDKLANA
ncbi:N-formylglutamate amidohydrolase [Alphaproteobacteria bacterium]|nr:N-formylglutamate amidohydrolase [Alphaproteobacteria bacterium]